MTPTPSRIDNLALSFQEVLTATVRLRAGRQSVPDAASFRHHMREALRSAAQEATTRGYPGEDIKLATFAVVAFLDESILNSRNPLFADWPRKPLQEELFGTHMAGEVFFQNLEQLLSRPDSPQLADLLEVYYLCLLLGFLGRYSAVGRGELKGVMDNVAAKIYRIRGRSTQLAPYWALPSEPTMVRKGDPVVKRMMYAAIACFLLAMLLFAGYKYSLSSGSSDLRTMAVQGRV